MSTEQLRSRGSRQRLAWLAVLLVLPWSLSADSRLSQRDADSMSRKLMAIRQHAELPAGGALLTPLTEAEINSYLQLGLAGRIPAGVRQPQITMIGEGRVMASAVVDLDAVRKATPSDGGWLDPRRFLSGQLPVAIRGLVRAANGQARFEFDSADVSGLPLPKLLLQEIVTFYSRSAEYPSGVDIDAPFDLPARIREIHVNDHQAVVVQ